MSFKTKSFAVSGALLAPLLMLSNPGSAAYLYTNDLEPRSFDISLAYNYSPDLSGFEQIPLGGTAGTTSYQRPTFNEADIKHASLPTIEFTYFWNPGFAFIGYEHLRPSGSAVLTEDLTTHGHTLLEGTDFVMSTQLDWYNVGIGYNRGYILDQLNLFATLEEDYMRFDYTFSGTESGVGCETTTNGCEFVEVNDGRSFNATTTRLGAGMHYNITNFVAVEIQGAFSLPFGNLRITTFGGQFEFKLYDTVTMAIAPYFGVSYQQIVFQDNQPVSNHIVATLNPVYSMGLKMSM